MAETVGMQLADSNTPMENLPRTPSFTLGALNVTPISMAEAYATFANRGIHCDPVILASAKTADGNSLPVPPGNRKAGDRPDGGRRRQPGDATGAEDCGTGVASKAPATTTRPARPARR